MRIVISDIHVRLIGHNLGHIQNILRFLEQNPPKDEYLFVLNPEAKKIPSIKSHSPKVTIQFFSEEEFSPYHSGMSMPKATRLIWNSLVKYANDFKAEKLILMEIDIYQHTIGGAKVPFDITGIMFRPYPRVIEVEGTLKSKIEIGIRKLKKIATAWWMCRNPKLEKVFVLNDKMAIEQMNRQLNTKVHTYLADPIYDYPSKADLDIRKKYGISENKRIFLVFGMIDEKKNVVNILKALQKLSKVEAKQTCLLVVGKIHENYKLLVENTLKETLSIHPEIQINFESRFVADDEMECFVGQSDVLFLAYINFFSSSGVIGLASRHNKPIIATKYGVLGFQTDEYELGIKVDPHNTQELYDSISFFIKNQGEYPKKAKEFVKNHTSKKFIRTLLEI